MSTEQRYSVPLTLLEIEALMSSLCDCSECQKLHSSALAQLTDVYYNCCEAEIIQDAETPVEDEF